MLSIMAVCLCVITTGLRSKFDPADVAFNFHGHNIPNLEVKVNGRNEDPRHEGIDPFIDSVYVRQRGQ
jgi:hypothetical protein